MSIALANVLMLEMQDAISDFLFFYFIFSITIYAKLQWIHNNHAGLIPVCTQLRNNKLQEKRCNVRLTLGR